MTTIAEAEQNPIVGFDGVGPEYLRVMGIPTLRGRGLSGPDGRDVPAEAVVTESVAREYWPGRDPIGQRLRLGGPNAAWTPLSASFPTSTSASCARGRPRCSSRGAISCGRGMSRSAPHATSRPCCRRFAARCTTRQQTREIGVRMALGATAGRLRRDVLARSLRVLAIGMAVGLIGAVVSTRLYEALLFQVGPLDPLTFAGAAAVLLLVALVAAFVPAQRATTIDPARALRTE